MIAAPQEGMLNGVAPPASAASSPVAWAAALPVEDREAVFIALLREIIGIHGEMTDRIEVDTPEGEYLGHFVPAAYEYAEGDRLFGKISPERAAELDRRARESEGIPAQQMIAELKEEAIQQMIAELKEEAARRIAAEAQSP